MFCSSKIIRSLFKNSSFFIFSLLVVPLPIMILGVFASAIQAIIFSTLAAAYIAEALEGH